MKFCLHRVHFTVVSGQVDFLMWYHSAFWLIIVEQLIIFILFAIFFTFFLFSFFLNNIFFYFFGFYFFYFYFFLSLIFLSFYLFYFIFLIFFDVFPIFYFFLNQLFLLSRARTPDKNNQIKRMQRSFALCITQSFSKASYTRSSCTGVVRLDCKKWNVKPGCFDWLQKHTSPDLLYS